MELTAETIYQVKYNHNWMLAKYVKRVEAHSYKYNDIYMDTLTTGPEKTRHVPLSHCWMKIRPAGYEQRFTLLDSGMEVRPASAESLAEVARLISELAQLEADRKAKTRELRELCD